MEMVVDQNVGDQSVTVFGVLEVTIAALKACDSSLSIYETVQRVKHDLDVLAQGGSIPTSSQFPGNGSTNVVVPPQITHTPSVREKFLHLEDENRGCKISCVEGAVTWVLDFKAAFILAMEPKTPIKKMQSLWSNFFTKGASDHADVAMFERHGFRLSRKREHMCRSCKQLALVGCCSKYAQSNRTQKSIFIGMELTKTPKTPHVA